MTLTSATTVAPSLVKGALPPVWSPWKCVLTRYLIGWFETVDDRRLDLVVQRREFAVHHDDAVLGHGDGDIAALAFEHVHVVAEIGGLDLDLGEIGRRGCGGRRLLRDGGPRQQQGGCDNSHSGPKHKTLPCPLFRFLAPIGSSAPVAGRWRACLNTSQQPSGAAYKKP